MQPAPVSGKNAEDLAYEAMFGGPAPKPSSASSVPAKPEDVAYGAMFGDEGISAEDFIAGRPVAPSPATVDPRVSAADTASFVGKDKRKAEFLAIYGDKNWEDIPEAERARFAKELDEADGIVTSVVKNPWEATKAGAVAAKDMAADVVKGTAALGVLLASAATSGDGSRARFEAAKKFGPELDQLAVSGQLDAALPEPDVRALAVARANPQEFLGKDGALDYTKYFNLRANLNRAPEHATTEELAEFNRKNPLKYTAEGIKSVEGDDLGGLRQRAVDSYVKLLGTGQAPKANLAIEGVGDIAEAQIQKDMAIGAASGAMGTARLVGGALDGIRRNPEEDARHAFEEHRKAQREAAQKSGVTIGNEYLEKVGFKSSAIEDAPAGVTAFVDPGALATAKAGSLAGRVVTGAARRGLAATGMSRVGAALEEGGARVIQAAHDLPGAPRTFGEFLSIPEMKVAPTYKALRGAKYIAGDAVGVPMEWAGRALQWKAPTYMVGKYGPGVADKLWQGVTFGALADAAGETDPSAALIPMFSGMVGLHAMDKFGEAAKAGSLGPIRQAVAEPFKVGAEFAADLITKREQNRSRLQVVRETGDNRFLKEHLDALNEATRTGSNVLSNYIRVMDRINPDAGLTTLLPADFAKAAEMVGADPKSGAFMATVDGRPQVYVELGKKGGFLEKAAHEAAHVWEITNRNADDGSFRSPEAQALFERVVKNMTPEEAANIRKTSPDKALTEDGVAREYFADQMGHWLRDINGDTSVQGGVRNAIGNAIRKGASKIGDGRSLSAGGTHGNLASLDAMTAFHDALGKGLLPRVGVKEIAEAPSGGPKDRVNPVQSTPELRARVAEMARRSDPGSDPYSRLGQIALADYARLPDRQAIRDRITTLADEAGVTMTPEGWKKALDAFDYPAGNEHRTLVEAREAAMRDAETREATASLELKERSKQAVAAYDSVSAVNRNPDRVKAVDDVVYPDSLPEQLLGTKAEVAYHDAIRKAVETKERLYKQALEAEIRRNAEELTPPPEEFAYDHPARLRYEEAVEAREKAAAAKADEIAKRAGRERVAQEQGLPFEAAESDKTLASAIKEGEKARTSQMLHELKRASRTPAALREYLSSVATEQNVPIRVLRARELAGDMLSKNLLKDLGKNLRNALNASMPEANRSLAKATGLPASVVRHAMSTIAGTVRTAYPDLRHQRDSEVANWVREQVEKAVSDKDNIHDNLVKVHSELAERIVTETKDRLTKEPTQGIPSEIIADPAVRDVLLGSISANVQIENAASQVAGRLIKQVLDARNANKTPDAEVRVPGGIREEATADAAMTAAERRLDAKWEGEPVKFKAVVDDSAAPMANNDAVGRVFKVRLDNSEGGPGERLVVVQGKLDGERNIEALDMRKSAEGLTQILHPEKVDHTKTYDAYEDIVGKDRLRGRNAVSDLAEFRKVSAANLASALRKIGIEPVDGVVTQEQALQVYSLFAGSQGEHTVSGVDRARLSESLKEGGRPLTPADRSEAAAKYRLNPMETMALIAPFATNTEGRSGARDVALRKAVAGSEALAGQILNTIEKAGGDTEGAPYLKDHHMAIAAAFGLRPPVVKIPVNGTSLLAPAVKVGEARYAPFRPYNDVLYAAPSEKSPGGSTGAAYAGTATGAVIKPVVKPVFSSLVIRAKDDEDVAKKPLNPEIRPR